MPIETRKGQIKINRGSININEDKEDELFPFTSFTFLNGNVASSETSIDNFVSFYKTKLGLNFSSNSWIDNAEYFSQVGGIQYFTVPRTGTYKIVARGAPSGTCYSTFSGPKYSSGATVIGDFDLVAGQIIKILVGKRGSNTYSTCVGSGGGGGGGTFIVDDASNTAIVVAGGGGGGGQDSTGPIVWTAINYGNANTTGGGAYPTNGRPGGGFNSGTEGSGGNGGDTPGGTSCAAVAGSGAGFSGNGLGGPNPIQLTSNHGKSFLNGGAGGLYSASAFGGYGGGGSTGASGYSGGGGGGYSGGGGGGLDNCSCTDLGGGGGGGCYFNPVWVSSPVTFTVYNAPPASPVSIPEFDAGNVTVTLVS
jgi:hypothetical protein